MVKKMSPEEKGALMAKHVVDLADFRMNRPLAIVPSIEINKTTPMLKCNGAHCKCMNLGGTCPNHHYATCKEHNPQLADNKPTMRSSEITKENLRVGDVIVHPDEYEKRVLEILEHVFLVNSGPLQSENGSIWLTFEGKALSNWRIKLPASEQPKQQLTHKQIEEKLGYEIEIIKE